MKFLPPMASPIEQLCKLTNMWKGASMLRPQKPLLLLKIGLSLLVNSNGRGIHQASWDRSRLDDDTGQCPEHIPKTYQIALVGVDRVALENISRTHVLGNFHQENTVLKRVKKKICMSPQAYVPAYSTKVS